MRTLEMKNYNLILTEKHKTISIVNVIQNKWYKHY